MKKIALAAGVLAAGLSLSLAPIASATEAEFTDALAKAGISGPSVAAAGYSVCQEIAKGTPEATTVTAIQANGSGLDANDAQLVYDAANEYLCAG